MAKKNYHAWRAPDGNGGVFDNYPDCQRAFSGVSGEKHKGFATYAEAWAFAFPGKLLSEADDKPSAVVPLSVINPPKANDNTADKPIPTLDADEVDRSPIGDAVREYCTKYRFHQLSEDQMRAVQAKAGRYLLFAVPGSGKTTVIMARTGYLIHACDIPAHQIMTLTFTRAAAEEMRNRYRRCFEDDLESDIPDFRTIHSFCYSIVLPRLRTAGYVFPKYVIDNSDGEDEKERRKRSSHSILSAVLRNNGVQRCGDETCQALVKTAISGVKNRMLSIDALQGELLRVDSKDIPLALLFISYEDALRKLDCLDYDDMLIHALQGLRACPEVLHTIQKRYLYWSIDETQDNSALQHELIALLSSGSGNLFMVGDDDQSIYAFRGAEPLILLDYGARSDVHVLTMGINYRSGRAIVESARAFIEYNKHRADKKMSAGRAFNGEIRFPSSFRHEGEQHAYIIAAARNAQKEARRLGVLFQFNVSALPLMFLLRREGIPYEASKGIQDICRGKIIDSILKMFRFALAPNSFERFEQCRDLLGLQTGKEHTAQIKEQHKKHVKKHLLDILLEVLTKDDRRREKAENAIPRLEAISQAAPAKAVELILYGFRLADEIKSISDRVCLYAFLSVCDQFHSIGELIVEWDAIAAEERRVADVKPTDSLEESDGAVATGKTPAVSLSTIHSAKGREWDLVILIDLFDQGIPGIPQPDRIGYDPEEMRRLFYVAITRAKRRLDLLTVESIHGNYEQYSCFISDYAFECEALSDGEAFESIRSDDLPGSTANSSQCLIRPAAFYGVPVGRVPGVYTNWDDVKSQTAGYSITPDRQPKRFDTQQEAVVYAFPDGDAPAEKSSISFDGIDAKILKNGRCFNRPTDFPKGMTEAFLDWFGVRSLLEMPSHQIDRLNKESKLFYGSTQVDYSRAVDGYVAVYLPVNFYKIWSPMWTLLKRKALPDCARILELGPGPGTSTCSVIEMYRQLALENPKTSFHLDYSVIERESAFKPAFKSFTSAVTADCPENLQIFGPNFIKDDAFSGMESLESGTYDLIIESNLLNTCEGNDGGFNAHFLRGIERLLSDSGKAILIEPGQNENMQLLESLTQMAVSGFQIDILEPPHKAAIDVSGIGVMRDLTRLNLRSKKMEHWFCTMILQRREVKG